MELNEISDNPGATKNRKRVGRGAHASLGACALVRGERRLVAAVVRAVVGGEAGGFGDAEPPRRHALDGGVCLR